MLKILYYNFITLSRFKMAKYQVIPEYIAIFTVIGLFTMIFMGVSSEEIIVHNNNKYMNFNILALYFFITPILSDIFMNNFYDVNYKYFKLLFPFNIFKTITIDVLLEILNYKLLFIFFFIALYIPFCSVYELSYINQNAIIGFCLVIIMYLNACLSIRLIKYLWNENFMKVYKNYLKAFLIILGALFIVNENTKTLTLNSFETTIHLSFFSVGLTILLTSAIFLINIKNDKF